MIETMTTATILKVVSFSGIAALMFQPDPQFWVMCGLLITGIGGIVESRMKAKSEERRHQWEKEDREIFRAGLKQEVAKVAAIAVTTKDDIRGDIAVNTELTREAVSRADKAYDVANHVNEKIARLAGGKLD